MEVKTEKIEDILKDFEFTLSIIENPENKESHIEAIDNCIKSFHTKWMDNLGKDPETIEAFKTSSTILYWEFTNFVEGNRLNINELKSLIKQNSNNYVLGEKVRSTYGIN